MSPYLVNFSDAVKPKPAITMYIIESKIAGVILYPRMSDTKPPAHNKNAKKVTTLLDEMVPLVPSCNILVK